MNALILNLLDAAPAPTSGGAGGNYTMILFLVLMFVIMYFFMIRPQQKRQKEIQKFRNSLSIGSSVVTSGGIYGTVKNLNEGTSYITIEISKGVEIKVDRNSVFADSAQAAPQK